MAVHDLTTRREVAELFPGDIRELCGSSLYDVSQADMIREVVKPGYISESLTPEVRSEDAHDVPQAWRFIIPATTVFQSLVAIDLRVPDQYRCDTETSPVAPHYRQLLETDTKRASAFNQAIRGLDSRFGSMIAKRVITRGDLFMVALERRCRPTADGQESISWTRLAYSQEMLGTGPLIREYVTRARTQGFPSPNWMYELAKTEYYPKAGRLMALSMLAGMY